MTCVVGIVKDGKVYIGADSLGSNGFDKEVRKESKVFTNGEFLLGFCGSFRMMNILKWKFNPPTIKEGDDVHKFMVISFIEELRKCFLESGASEKEGIWNLGSNNELLVGIKGRLFKVQYDLQVAEYEYTACGSGEYHALGSLYTSKRKSPKKDIVKALECAENFVVSVQRPFNVMEK